MVFLSFLGSVFMWFFGFVLFFFKLGLFLLSLLLSLLWWFQPNLLYIPQATRNRRQLAYNELGWRSPKDWGIPFDDVFLQTKDKVGIHAWLLKQTDTKSAPTLLFFHGNAGNIGYRLNNAKALYQLGINVFLVEYRGYGNSEGIPSEAGLIKDSLAALEYLQGRTDIDSGSIMAFGRSLGGAVAIALAHSNSDALSGIILENTSRRSPIVWWTSGPVWGSTRSKNCAGSFTFS
eukprot:211523_1